MKTRKPQYTEWHKTLDTAFLLLYAIVTWVFFFTFLYFVSLLHRIANYFKSTVAFAVFF
jgi:hypothetical protein